MKDRARQVTSLVFVPVLVLTLLCSFAYFAPGKRLCAVSAQSTPLNGSFGFALNSWQTKSNTDINGFAMLGVMNLDGAGGITGAYTIEIGATEKDRAQTLNGTFAGTYSSNPDSTGGMTLTLDAGVSLKFTFVITEGGQGFNLVATNATGADFGGTVMSGFAKAAYIGALNGSYGFQLNNSPTPTGTLGVMNLDGAGNATVSFTSVGAPRSGNQPPVTNGKLTGTYSTNPDGSGVIDLTASSGGKFAMVATDSGSALQLLLTDGTGNNVSFGTARLR